MAHKGKLKYSADLNFWYIVMEDGIFYELFNGDLIDAILNLDGHYFQCAINITMETISFSNIDFMLNKCFDYDIIFYIPPRINEDNYLNF
jgi:hypothetical protein